VALAAPADTTVAFLEEFADGLREGCAALAPGAGVVGGDLSVSATLTIAVTALGDLEGRAPVTRAGARAGDVVAVSGALGAAAEGLRLLFELGEPDAATAAALRLTHPAQLAAQLRPHPPIADGTAAALAGATAMLDLSDSLALDAARLARASGVAIAFTGVTEAELIGGEDHSLLATFPLGTPLPGGFRAIGTVLPGDGILVDGVPFEPRGWDPYLGWDGAGG
jgi:thiamine-monophosphate kinase